MPRGNIRCVQRTLHGAMKGKAVSLVVCSLDLLSVLDFSGFSFLLKNICIQERTMAIIITGGGPRVYTGEGTSCTENLKKEKGPDR